MKRVMIIGGPGSGKSTLAHIIGKRLDLPVTHIDRLQFKPGWVEEDPEIRDAAIRKVIAGPRWVIDGNYSSTAGDRMARADTLIWLDLPLGLRIWRICLRTVRNYGKCRSDMADGCPERFSFEFFHYVISTRKTQYAKARARYFHMSQSANAFRLASRRDVDAFVGDLP